MNKACRSCGNSVFWVVTEKGKRMPLDPEPADNGNVELYPNGDELVAHYVHPDQPNLMSVPRYISHFATCPQAHQWRRP